jgi:error-prone DNA polymerase
MVRRGNLGLMPFCELHARSAFSFLRGGSVPECFAREAGRLQLAALAVSDRDGVYGSVRLHFACKEAGVRPIVGCELTMEDETVVPLLVENKAGYRGLCRLLTTTHLRAPKCEGRTAWRELAESREGLVALTGDEEGPVRRAWRERGARAAAEAGERLLRIFGKDSLFVEIQRHQLAEEDEENEFLADFAADKGLPLLATNGPLYAVADARQVLDVFTCLREHTTLEGAGTLLAPNSERHLKGPETMAELFADLPQAVSNSERLADRLRFTLDDFGYRFPEYAAPAAESQDAFLRKMTYFGAQQRYGSVEGAVRRQLERELGVIIQLGFAGYFLVVWDICAFCREKGILVQGRGSAANSAVCYSLGITAVDPIASKLLFERFLSEGRTGWPDIDLDLPSGERREAVIQEVYRRYGRRGAAMTANVITYRGRNTMREVGKVFGFSDDILDRFSSLYHGGDFPQTLEMSEQIAQAGVAREHPRLPALLETCGLIHGLPRHLGQHSGGMVLSAGGLDQFVPLENARMPNRSVLQWDKDDCEDLGLIKVDLLGLGMMAALQDSLTICAERGEPVDLAQIPRDDPETFKLIQAADTVGVFQIESRAQMATLPRMRPETFYDVAIEVAIIRPGPIQGNAVNPYLARRCGDETVTYPDPRAQPILERTLGVVLFQEQILRLAMELGGFSAAEADELRRAIGFTRSQERLNKMKRRLAEGMAANGVLPAAAESILQSLSSFALYGFPESHAISFALIAYASAWLKVHRPAAFYAAILNNQPMGFYSPATLVQDARRRGIRTLPVCVQVSDAGCRVVGAHEIHLGLASVHGVREQATRSILAARGERPFASLTDFLRRTELSAPERRALAAAGALNALAGHRRAALWQVEGLEDGELFRQSPVTEEPSLSPLERMTFLQRIQADFRHMSLTTGAHPMSLVRAQLPGVLTAADLARTAPGTHVRVGGSVITRQRPGTAKGFVFITLEDESGHTNAIVRPKLFEEVRQIVNLEPALLITGRLQNEKGVIHVMAENIEPLPASGLPEQAAHDYH